MRPTRNFQPFMRKVFNPRTLEFDNMEMCNPYIYESFLNTFFKVYNSGQQVMLVRFDLFFPKNYDKEVDPRTISRFVNELKKRVQRRSLLGEKSIVCETFWVREWSKISPHPHFHIILFISTNIIQNKKDVIENLVEYVWKFIIGSTYKKGLVHHSDRFNDNYLIFSKASIDVLLNHPNIHYSPELQKKYKELNMLFEHAKYLSKYKSKPKPNTENNVKIKAYSGTRGYQYTQEDLAKFPMANPYKEE